MIRTVSAFAIVSLVVLIALRVAFGVMGGMVGLLFMLAILAIKLVCIAGVTYFALNVVSPDTAKKVRQFFGVDERVS